ncbi:MAG: hypothetical protein P1P82_09195 [Bacteroidales bacterium]|nr:hypothetical protein [Bacteroidales bacterium]MDT8430587.1 hypothetical protein [Bacteroidales bacterium]
MFIKLILTSVIIVGLIVLSMSLKLIFHTDSGLDSSSCAVLKGDRSAEKEACSTCALKQLVSGGEGAS